MTPAAVESDLNDALFGFKDKASNIKEAHRTARQAIKDDTRRTTVAKNEDLAALAKDTRSKLEMVKEEQESYIKDLRDKVEREFRGSQSADANSVLLRRDAADRARKITDRQEAMDILTDALANGDDSMAHAVGVKARNLAWVDVAENYQAAFPSTAGSAEALSYIDELTTGAAYNVATSIAYSAPE